MKNIKIAVLILAFAVMFAGGCSKRKTQPSASPSASATAEATATSSEKAENVPQASPTATPNPKLRYTEGRVLDTKTPSVEGPVLALTDDTLDVKVADETYSFQLGEQGKLDVEYFNKNPEKPRIMEGTVIIVNYENVGENKVVTSLEIVESN